MPANRQRPVLLVLSCEHAGNRVPPEYAPLFGSRRATALLETHRALDLGAARLGRPLARRLQAPLFAATTTRLLVDLNRAPGNPAVFSAYTCTLAAEEKQRLLERHHTPHRRRVAEAVRTRLAGGERVVHVAIHSFTPVLFGRPRRADIGLLYDPGRRFERDLVGRWQEALREALPDWRILRNDPYRGTTDGLGQRLRRVFPAARYAALELEVNQRHLVGADATPVGRRRLVRALSETLRLLVAT